MGTIWAAFTAVLLGLTPACVHPNPETGTRNVTKSAAECHYSMPDAAPIFAESEVDKPPILVSRPHLEYPDELRRAGVPGRVVVVYVIDSTGSVIGQSFAVDSATHAAFVPPVRAMVLGFRFQPALRQFQAVPVCVLQAINWTIS
jgi:TonB family protein